MNQNPEKIVNKLAEVKSLVERTPNIKTVFGEPIESDGITIIPVAAAELLGGAGGGASDNDSQHANRGKNADAVGGEGFGMGFWGKARPVGFIKLRDGDAEFVQTLDKNLIVVRGMLIGITAFWFCLRFCRLLLRRKRS